MIMQCVTVEIKIILKAIKIILNLIDNINNASC